jgi:hypothetical protein
MRTRRLLLAIAAGSALLLSGCTLLTPITLQGSHADDTVRVGSCLDGMNGNDSDRSAIVSCTDQHLYEVTGIAEWPGMAALIAAGDAGQVWDDLHASDGSGAGGDYLTWASRECQRAALDVLGISGLVVNGDTALDVRLTAGGGYGIDLSLGSRREFVAGDHRTVCSVAWYEDGPVPRSVTDPDGVGFAGYLGPGVPLSLRECWDIEGYVVPCTRPHGYQVVAGFDGAGVFDPDIIDRTATGELTDDDYAVIDEFCAQLSDALRPGKVAPPAAGFLGESTNAQAWDDYDGTVDPDGGYFYTCLVRPNDTDSRLTGDLFDGTLAAVADGSEGA